MIKKTGAPVHVVTCATLQEFEDAISANQVDFCIVDHELDQGSGLDAVASVKIQAGKAPIPVVMISGHEDVETVVGSIRAGCVDYVAKGTLTPEKLHSVIYGAVSNAFASEHFTDEICSATSTILKGIAKGCSSELQPRLKRVYKQADFIRSRHARGVLPSPDAVDEIEDQCLKVWRFFDEVGQYAESLGQTRH